MTVPAVFVRNTPGSFVAYAKMILTVRCSEPFAPGQPVPLRIDEIPLEGKSIGSRRQADGQFEVRMRLINLRREHRLHLEAL